MIMTIFDLVMMSVPLIGMISFLVALILDEREFRREMLEESDYDD